MNNELHAVFATDGQRNVYRVSDPMSWDRAQREWDRLYTLKHEDRLPQVKFFEVRSVTLGPDRPLVGPEVRSHDKYDKAPLDMNLTKPVVGLRGYSKVEDAARSAWKVYFGTRFSVRKGVGRERQSDEAGYPTGVQGRGGWFYYPNGTVAAQGLTDLARVALRRRMVVQGLNSRWYVVEQEVLS